MTPSAREALVLLTCLDGVGPRTLLKIKNQFEDVVSVFGSSVGFLTEHLGIQIPVAERILRAPREHSVEEELAYCSRENIRIITLWDDEYPAILKEIFDPPAVIFVKGKLESGRSAVGVVGARAATQYGTQTAFRLSFQLASAGLVVVSGLARGIDSQAHEGALCAQGLTWAVMGSGFRHFYPRENLKLADRIAEKGCVISEFASDVAPVSANFPRRNRLISGLSRGVLVVEASKNSGSLITSDFALEQGRSVMAVPGRIDAPSCAGTLQLIRDGAKMVLSVEDVFEELGMETALPAVEEKQDPVSGTPEERMILDTLCEEPQGIDELSMKTQIPAHQLLSLLFTLEMKRKVKPLPGKRYVRMGSFAAFKNIPS